MSSSVADFRSLELPPLPSWHHFGSERVQFEALRFPCDLPKERFDFATCFESLEHVEEDGALLETLARSLAPGGLLFVSVPNEETLPIAHNAAFFKFHVRHYRTEQLVELAASKGLALRARTGQYAYRTAGPRAVEPLPVVALAAAAAAAEANVPSEQQQQPVDSVAAANMVAPHTVL